MTTSCNGGRVMGAEAYEIGKATLPCPDCGGEMVLQEKPPQWGNGAVYLCRDRAKGCRGLCSAHPDGSPQGTPANQETRRARNKLHAEMLDPLWLTAERYYDIREKRGPARKKAIWKIRMRARPRVYRYLADKLGITEDDCHIGMFDLDMCRKAWVALAGVKYREIRDWAKAVEDREAA